MIYIYNKHMVKYNSAKSTAILPNCGQGNWGSKRLDN